MTQPLIAMLGVLPATRSVPGSARSSRLTSKGLSLRVYGPVFLLVSQSKASSSPLGSQVLVWSGAPSLRLVPGLWPLST
ncbi:MAG TPA: hypothetical protein VGD91_02540 [Trebonia sp.]